jgi:hypothetical protein
VSESGSAWEEPIKLWPLWAAIGFPLLLIVLNATPLAPDFVFVTIGLPALLLVWAAAGIYALALAIRRLQQRLWNQSAIDAVLPFILGIVSLHLFIVRQRYSVQAVLETPTNGEPRLLVFNRGGMLWASRGFVYDERDEVIRDPSVQSSAWKNRSPEFRAELRLWRPDVPRSLRIDSTLVPGFVS